MDKPSKAHPAKLDDIDTEAIQRVEQVKGQLKRLVGSRIIDVLSDSDGYQDFVGLRVESPTGEVLECWLADVVEANVEPA